jgi:hypothetical protein
MSKHHARTSMLAAVVLVAALAGCVESTGLGATATPMATDGRSAPPEGPLGPDSQVNAPVWQVGQWFNHHVFFGSDDLEGDHLSTVVVDDSGAGYRLATDDLTLSKEHAVLNLPILGNVQKDSLALDGLEVVWDYYEFPLRAGKTWGRSVGLPGDPLSGPGPSYDATFTASFNATINAAGEVLPGFQIEATTTDGTKLLTIDYVPSTGWYAHFTLFEPRTDDPDDYMFHVMSMGTGLNWTGTYYEQEPRQVLELLHIIAADPAGPIAQVQPLDTFTVEESATYVFGVLLCGAVTGATQLAILEPQGTAYRCEATAPAPLAGADDFRWFDQAAAPGDWTAAIAGAGIATWAGAFLWELTETQGHL